MADSRSHPFGQRFNRIEQGSQVGPGCCENSIDIVCIANIDVGDGEDKTKAETEDKHFEADKREGNNMIGNGRACKDQNDGKGNQMEQEIDNRASERSQGKDIVWNSRLSHQSAVADNGTHDIAGSICDK